MSGCCSGPCDSAKPDPTFRRVLWIALVVNAMMFAIELAGGLKADSSSLLADAADFLGDAANYAVSLFVLGLASVWRSRAAALKGLSMGAYGFAVLAVATYNLNRGALPEAGTMGAIGFLALTANASVAALLYRFRTGDANMRSVWLCTRNDAIGNVAVMMAALGVFGTGSAWPDFAVAMIMATLGLTAAYQVMRQAGMELGWWVVHESRLAEAFSLELREGEAALRRGELEVAYTRFERAHILGQMKTRSHIKSHVAFLRWAMNARDYREALGQLGRILAAGFLTWLWVPRGNTGGARVSAVRAMPIPPDLQVLMEKSRR